MVTLATLWLPIVLSAVGVFILSFLVWNVLPWHRNDFAAVPREEEARRALQGLDAGQYNLPHVADRADLAKAEVQEKFTEGPVAFLVVLPNGLPNLPKSLGLWFAFSLVVGVVAAYVAGRTLPAGAEYLEVFRITGTVAWVAYGWAYVQESVWFGRPWSFSFKMIWDALLYALVTAGVFGWLWP